MPMIARAQSPEVHGDEEAPGNRRSLQTHSGRDPDRKVPSLARALAVTLRLVRIHLAHLLEQVSRIRPRDVGRTRTIAIPLLRPPWHRRLLHALRHIKKVRDKSLKGKLSARGRLASAARKCQSASPCIARPSRF